VVATIFYNKAENYRESLHAGKKKMKRKKCEWDERGNYEK
jgi:hypothetical protein